MDDQQLRTALRSMGKGCFAKYYDAFCESSRTNDDIAEEIRREEGYTPKSCRTRTSHARRIIAAGRGEEALALCRR